jgi:hypothetical protein
MEYEIKYRIQEISSLTWREFYKLLNIHFDAVEITKAMHKFAPMLHSYMLAPTCFGSSLPSSGSFWIRLS